MPGFSFTAPVVTPEEERQEREQLSKEYVRIGGAASEGESFEFSLL